VSGHARCSKAGRFRFAADELATVQLVSGIDDALRIRRREQLRAQGRRRLMVLLAVLGTLAVLGGYKLLAMSSAFAVDSVSVSGAPPQLQHEIASAVQAEAGGHSLLTVDRGAIAQRLSQMPYVRSVTVDRAFPHTLGIKVAVERPAIVVAAASGGYLVSNDGRVLELRTKPPAGLPMVRVRAALAVLRDSGDELSGLRIVTDGVSVFACYDDGQILDALRNGQLALFVAVDRYAEMLRADVAAFTEEREAFLTHLKQGSGYEPAPGSPPASHRDDDERVVG